MSRSPDWEKARRARRQRKATQEQRGPTVGRDLTRGESRLWRGLMRKLDDELNRRGPR